MSLECLVLSLFSYYTEYKYCLLKIEYVPIMGLNNQTVHRMLVPTLPIKPSTVRGKGNGY